MLEHARALAHARAYDVEEDEEHEDRDLEAFACVLLLLMVVRARARALRAEEWVPCVCVPVLCLGQITVPTLTGARHTRTEISDSVARARVRVCTVNEGHPYRGSSLSEAARALMVSCRVLPRAVFSKEHPKGASRVPLTRHIL